MRKSFLVLLLMLGLSVTAHARLINQSTEIGVIEEGAGTASDGVRVFQLVRNPNQTAAASTTVTNMASRDAVVWDVVSDDNCTVNWADRVGITTSSDALAGILVTAIPSSDTTANAANQLSTLNWGYIQTYGRVLASVDASGITVGQGFKASLTNGNVVAGAANASGGAGGSYGFALDTCASGGECEVFIRTR